LDIAGNVVVVGQNVRITRSRIRATDGIVVRVLGSVVIEDSELSGGGAGMPAVCCSNYTLRRVNVHDVFEGPRLSNNTVVEDSYIHHLKRCPGCHVDVLQSTNGTGIRVRRNNLQAFNPVTRDPMNAAFQFGETLGVIRDCLFEGNLMNGGNFTVNGGGGGTTGSQCTFRDNRFGRDYRYGPVGNLGPGVVFDASTNLLEDTKQPVRAK
jgi:hypothetical protein